jgi:hypothetical protein
MLSQEKTKDPINHFVQGDLEEQEWKQRRDQHNRERKNGLLAKRLSDSNGEIMQHVANGIKLVRISVVSQ